MRQLSIGLTMTAARGETFSSTRLRWMLVF